MNARSRRSDRLPIFQSSLTATLFMSAIVGATGALAEDRGVEFKPGNLLVSRSVYDNKAANVATGMPLPPNCIAPNCFTATSDGSYPNVWNNVLADASFGITSKIMLDQLKPSGELINSLEVPNSSDRGTPATKDQMVTSFSSSSEMALNLSTDGRVVTFMGYLAPINTIDVSNSNTPAAFDPTDPVPGSFSRVVAELDQNGRFNFTKTNAYSGNNGRAAILNGNVIYTVGNAGNGSNPQPNGIIIGAGAQIMTAERKPLAAQDPGLPTPVGSFSISQLGLKADKVGKDTNFRGLTTFNNAVYTTKGSGSNGINTVYFIDTTGFEFDRQAACVPERRRPAASDRPPAFRSDLL